MTGHCKWIVMVTGAVPGLGKSSLCRDVASALSARGEVVEVFWEEEIEQRIEFAEVIATFRAGGTPSRDQLLDAASAHVATCVRRDTTFFVQDMLFPYLPSLLAWGYSDAQIRDFLSALASRCGSVRLVQIHLVGAAGEALDRAVAREDPHWLDRLLAKVRRYRDLESVVLDRPSLVRHFEQAQARTMQLLATTPWVCEVVDTTGGASGVASEALRIVTTALDGAPPQHAEDRW